MANLTFTTAQALTIQAAGTVTAATNASPIAVTTSAPHGLLTGDMVQISGSVGNTAANGQFVITKTSSTAFTLNNSNGNGAWSSGGTVTHIGTSCAAVLVDNTVFTAVPDFTLFGRLETLSAGANARFVFTDAADSAFVTEQPLAMFEQVGGIGKSYDVTKSFKKEDAPDARMAASGDNFRVKLFVSGGPGATATWSAWLRY